MIIWTALIVPIIGAFIMLRWFRKHLAWWEVVIPMIACIIFALIFKFGIEQIQITDTEYWSGLVQKAEYYEPYETWVHKTCSRTVKVGKTTTTVYYDCSYCDDYRARYYVSNDIGEKYEISKSKYEELMKRWSSKPQFVDLRRNINYRGLCGKDGDKYEIYWDRRILTSEQTVSSHYYENRIQAAHTAFDFVDVTEDDIREYGLYEYPKISGYQQKALLGVDSVPWVTQKESKIGSKLMEYSSGYWGPRKHGKIWILLFVDKPQLSAHLQESYWEGGNDNDLVVCIGLSSKNKDLQWVKPFSWTPNRKILVDIREDIMQQKQFSFTGIQSVLDKNMPKYERKDFQEFDYVTVEPPTWAIIVTFILTIGITFGLCYWAITNEYAS